MAELLYRLGKAAARRAWVVIRAWAVALALAAVAFVAFGGVLGSAITIPGTPTQQVSDRLQEVLPEAGGGAATIVFHPEDGEPLTDAQRADISVALGDVVGVDGVKSVTDPFETAQEVLPPSLLPVHHNAPARLAVAIDIFFCVPPPPGSELARVERAGVVLSRAYRTRPDALITSFTNP